MSSLPMDMLQLILEHLCTSDIASLGRAVVALGSEPQLWLRPWLASVRVDEQTRRIGHWRLIGAANRSELLTLTEVDVSGRQMGPALGLAVERAIYTAPALARLYLCGNALGAEGVGPIVRALATAPLCGVTCLDLCPRPLEPGTWFGVGPMCRAIYWSIDVERAARPKPRTTRPGRLVEHTASRRLTLAPCSRSAHTEPS